MADLQTIALFTFDRETDRRASETGCVVRTPHERVRASLRRSWNFTEEENVGGITFKREALKNTRESPHNARSHHTTLTASLDIG